MLCPVRRLVTILLCVLLKDSSLVLGVGLGPEIKFQSCLWVLIRIHHIAICWFSIHLFIFFLIFAWRPPRLIQVQQSGEWYPLLRAHRQFHFLVPQNIQGPKTVPQNARWKFCSMHLGTIVPVGSLFWLPERLSKPPDYQSKY